MMNLKMNRGFELMIPKKSTKEKKDYFNHQINFTLFKKEFSISVQVK